MINKDNLEAEPFFVSINGQLKKDQSWILFDHFQIQDDQLFLIGLDLQSKPIRTVFEEVEFSDSQLEYAINFIQTLLNERQNALMALKKIKDKRSFTNDDV